MSRSSFFSRRSSHDNDPLLPQYKDSTSSRPISLRDLSPRSENSKSPFREVSPSPPPSFYRDNNFTSNNQSQHTSLSPSPSRTKPRRIQFSAPPPPIATSVLLPPGHSNSQSQTTRTPQNALEVSSRGSRRNTSPHIIRRGSGLDPLIGLERRERAIQQDLQTLLDAQSAGLIQGFGGATDGASDAGSSTPTRTGQRSGSASGSQSRTTGRGNKGIIPVRQPKGRTIGLRGARRGLLREMGELVLVKEEEFGILDNEIERREKVLVRVTEWETRIEGARARLADNSGSEGGEEDREISELRDEERAVETEIREMEDRLLQMKARQRWLKERINEGVNRREARLSGYRGALREVEGEVRQFLKAPPIPVSIVMGEEEGFVALPPSRRTLEMAKEWWSKEIGALHGRKKEVGREKEALEEGAKMWRESIDIVVEFEDELRRQMKSTEVQDVDGLRKQIGKMETAISKLEETVKIAEERGWNLLICVVGAELEAFKEGVAILRGALVGLGGASVEASFRTAETGSEDKTREVSSVDGLHGLDGLGEMGRVEGVGGQLNREESLEREESEDDGPNLAELLVDHGGE